MVERELEKLKSSGLDSGQVEKEKQRLASTLAPEAKKKVQGYFILREIADREGLKIEKKDIDDHINSEARRYNRTYDQIYNFFQQQDKLKGLSEELLLEKSLNLLLKNADISIVEQ